MSEIVKKEFNTSLTKINGLYLPMIERQFTSYDMKMNDYSKRCVMTAISAINTVLEDKGIAWGDPLLDQNNVGLILFNVACLELNSLASPNEVYFQMRNVKRKGKDGKDIWIKQIEMGIEGDGNDAILSRFGRNVKQVMPHWLVREHDEFHYPSYVGLEMTPPRWTPKGAGKVVRIVYPVIDTNNIVHYYIGEREDVRKNLVAHIKNNLMNETFGIAKDRYSATPNQLKQIAEQKKVVLGKLKGLSLDEILDHEELQSYISPAWKEEQSRESMIIRKIRNNIVKPIPKNFSNGVMHEAYSMLSDESYRAVKENIIEHNGLVEERIEIAPMSEGIDDETGEIIEPIREVEDKGIEPKSAQIEPQRKSGPQF